MALRSPIFYAAGNDAPHRAQCDHPGCTVPRQPGHVFESASPQTAQNVNDYVDLPEHWREDAREKTLRVVEEMRGGRIEPAPANPDKCRYCDYKDACRVQSAGVTIELEEEVEV